MSGVMSGVAKGIQDVAPSAACVYCYAHRLNLVLVYSCKSVKEAGCVFFTTSAAVCVYVRVLCSPEVVENSERNVSGKTDYGAQTAERHSMGLQG